MPLRGVRLSTKAGRRCATVNAPRRLQPKLLERSPGARPSNDPSRTPPLRESTGARPVRERCPKRGPRSTFRRVSPGPLTPVGGTTRSAPPAVAPRPHPAGVIAPGPGHGAPNRVRRRTHGPQRLAADRRPHAANAVTSSIVHIVLVSATCAGSKRGCPADHAPGMPNRCWLYLRLCPTGRGPHDAGRPLTSRSGWPRQQKPTRRFAQRADTYDGPVQTRPWPSCPSRARGPLAPARGAEPISVEGVPEVPRDRERGLRTERAYAAQPVATQTRPPHGGVAEGQVDPASAARVELGTRKAASTCAPARTVQAAASTRPARRASALTTSSPCT